MKKILFDNRFLLWLLLAMWAIAFLTACKGVQSHSDTVRTDFFSRQNELFVMKNLRINDSLVLPVPMPETRDKKCDSLCQIEVQRLLKLLNTKKKSGSNEYGFYYDEYKKTLTAYAILDSTFSAFKTEKSQQKTENYRFEIVRVSEKYVPVWIQILAWIGGGWLMYFCINNYKIIRKLLPF
ncbi:hypothetical protein [Capnocytophaga sp.]|uniref:hypothetical protein n=1 Tax=Capnocytophaga sp. TaxID=44737 RepID=UPI0026DD9680|nr:hypothetical protein [Capnocytophaga sp.]MDO5106495.1 hypothetical protein [Capnocytophaga sp.]